MKRKLISLAVALLCSVGMWAYQTPVADGVYYLYNTGVTDGGSGFICRGEDYAQRAVIDKYGIPFKLISTGNDDTYYFQAYDTDLWLSDDGFMYTDGGNDRRRAIKVELQSDGIYKLLNTNNSKEVENWYGHPVGDGTGNRRDYLWQFLSVAEYETVIAGYTATEKSSIATTMGWVLTDTDFDSYLSTNYAVIDKTSLIDHATFDTGHSTSGWTVTANAHSSMAIGWGNEGGDKITPEVYQGYGTISQTVTVPNAGLYKVSVNAYVRNNNYVRFHDAGAVSSVSYLQVNDNKVRICDIYSNGEVTSNFPDGPNAANTNYFSNGNYLNEVYVYVGDSKQLTITLCNPSSTAGCWMVFNNFKLTYYSDQVSDDDATEILATAESLESEIMQASVLSALSSAKSTFDSSNTISDYNTLSTAISNAEASVAAYSNAKAYLDRIYGYLTGSSTYTNFYTSTAYDTYYANYKYAYDNRTMTTEVGNSLSADVAYQSGTTWHKVNNLDNIMLSTWTVGVTQCNEFDAALYVNTWSIEGNTDGSEFYAPFYEYWVSSANTLAANTFTSTITGLKESTTYSVTIRCRVQPTDGKTIINDAIQMQVGDGDAVTISAGAKYSTTAYYIGNFTAVGTTDAEGNLVTTITVADASNVSWLAFYNVRYTEGEDLSAYIADYEFALGNAETAQSKPMDPNMKSDLDDAVDDYGSLDTGSATKAELIEAKEALEAALAAANPSIAALAGSDYSLWTTTGNNGNFQVNTWSTEGNSDGSNMTTPFIQNWINKNSGTLGEATMSYTLKDQTAGYYRVRGLVRTLKENGGVAPEGSFFFANAALQRVYNGSDCTNGKYKNADVYAYVGDDGDLTIGIKIIKGNFNWISWKNLSVEYIGTTLTQTMADNLTAEARTFTNNTAAQATEAAAVGALSTLSDANYVAAGAAIEAAYRANDRDFSALASALSAKAGYVLGFLNGEYAPYSGIEAAYTTANAIDQNSESTSQSDINAAATALSNISANVGELNAVYNGDFALSDNNGAPAGWTLTGATGTGNSNNTLGGDYRPRAFVLTSGDNYGKLATFGQGDGTRSAFYFRFDDRTAQDAVYTYGATDGYTMPLKTSKIYKLTAKVGGWGHTKDIKVAIVNTSDDNIVAQTLTLNNVDNSDEASDYEMYFVVPTAGNYKMQLTNATADQNNAAVISNIELKSTEALVLADGTTYSAGTYPTVTLDRTFAFTDRWYTLCVPFAFSKDNFAAVKVLNSISENGDNVSLKFADVDDDDVAAGTPCLVQPESENYSSLSATSVEIDPDDDPVDTEITKDGYTVVFKGTFTDKGLDSGDNAWVVSSNKLWSVNSDVTVGAYKAYFTATASGSVKSLLMSFDDDIETGIVTIENGELKIENAPVYNLAGQRVSKSQKGIYVKNGRKVVIK